MSARDSIQPGTGSATQSDARSEPLPGRRDSSGRRESFANEASAESFRAVSGKRKLSETESTGSASKRQRGNEFTSEATGSTSADSDSLGALFGVPEKPYPISRPHFSQDLITLCGLQETAAGVARLDPRTGLKNTANKLRKSYAKHIKDLPGSHEASKNPGELKHFLEWPEEMYFAERRMNREVERGFPENLAGKLDKAVQLASGRLSAAEESRWQAYINQNEDGAKTGAAPVPATSNAPAPYSATTPAGAPSRSRRSGAKRRYDDESFEGYSESFADEKGALRAEDEDDEGSATMKKKQPRRRVGHQTPQMTATTTTPTKPQQRIRLSQPKLEKTPTKNFLRRAGF